MSGCVYRIFRITNNGILKLNGYATHDFPKTYKSWSFETDRNYFNILGVEAIFVKEILTAYWCGGIFRSDALVMKYNILGILMKNLEDLGIQFNEFIESWHSYNQNKEYSFDKIEIVKQLAQKNSETIKKFIRKK